MFSSFFTTKVLNRMPCLTLRIVSVAITDELKLSSKNVFLHEAFAIVLVSIIRQPNSQSQNYTLQLQPKRLLSAQV